MFGFLPIVLPLYFLLPQRFRNLFLFLCSVFFWFWANGAIVLVFLLSSAVTYCSGRIIARSNPKRARAALAATILINLAILIYYKYFNFLWSQLALLLGLFSLHLSQPAKIALPIGISFFIFEAISYSVEIYRKAENPARRFTDFGAYLGAFPHFVAGPIVRFSDVSDKLRSRPVTVDLFFSGICRFAQGLGKKVFLANTLGRAADRVFDLSSAQLTTPLAWLGILCYTLQIYYDFSGYSDMAIGLGRFLGFTFPENFDQPYRSKNITEFWQRWHITLATWLRDFLFIPLGANRKGPARTYLNIFIVFFLCGLWHGAAWTFVVWGVYHGVLLIGERALRNRFHFQTSGIPGNVLTFLLLIIGWVFFRSQSLKAAWSFLGVMFSLKIQPSQFQFFPFRYYLENDVLIAIVLGAIFAWFPAENLELDAVKRAAGWTVLRASVALLLILYAATVLSTVGFNPFIYSRF
jgi:alginate O-acetyltransferase complex protein AlgI